MTLPSPSPNLEEHSDARTQWLARNAGDSLEVIAGAIRDGAGRVDRRLPGLPRARGADQINRAFRP